MRSLLLSLVISFTMAISVADSGAAFRSRPPVIHTIDGPPPLLRRRPVRRRYHMV